MHIGIAGNIGSGKTTLTRMLAGHYGWTPKYEAVTYNPYIEDYYKDIHRWSFNLEIYFLTKRFKDGLRFPALRKPSSRTGPYSKACTYSQPTTGTWETFPKGISPPIWSCSN